jgi:hypothetical protein
MVSRIAGVGACARPLDRIMVRIEFNKLRLLVVDDNPQMRRIGLAIPAESLCRLIEHTRNMRRIPIALVDQHVDAVRAIIREGSRPDAEQTVAVLTRRLRDVTDEFLAREDRDRPDELEDILSPSLALGDTSF